MVEVIAKEDKRGYVTFKTTCTNQLGKLVIRGEAVGIPPKK
jgi:acyl dehydratase